ncbi:nuclear pore complex protein Nup58 [Drosophila subobscura]|uniref:nuclear pore complex protein Nup58 n=1 Tax=Drosophila subobscura TaxID=7241 RepID=UPI00155AB93A|nr:nuclear pore complex protein Nup58 [Drosophila subobscura]
MQQQMLVILSLGLMVACTGALPAVGPALFPAASAAPFGVFPGSAAAPFAAYTNGQFGVPFGAFAGVPFGAAAGAPFGAAASLVSAPLAAAPLAVSSSQRLDYFNQFNAAFGPPAAGRLLAAGPAGVAPFPAGRLIQPARLIAPGSFFF